MKFLAQLFVTAIVCFVLQYFLPWWTMALGAFAMGYLFSNSGFTSFAAGLLGVALLWLVMAYYIDMTTDSILTDKVAKILPMNVFILTSLVGGLVGGFAALTGAVLKSKGKAKYGMERY
jgi:hypothetical protein